MNKPARDEKGRMLPGHSLNPAGRRPMPAEVRAAIERIGPEAVNRLEELLKPRRFARLDSKSQIKVIEVALNRCYGKPHDAEPRQLQVTGAVEHEHTLSIHQLVERINAEDQLPEFRNARRATDAEDAEEVDDASED